LWQKLLFESGNWKDLAVDWRLYENGLQGIGLWFYELAQDRVIETLFWTITGRLLFSFEKFVISIFCCQYPVPMFPAAGTENV
jgi:hypothetical protein